MDPSHAVDTWSPEDLHEAAAPEECVALVKEYPWLADHLEQEERSEQSNAEMKKRLARKQRVLMDTFFFLRTRKPLTWHLQTFRLWTLEVWLAHALSGMIF